MLFRSGILLWVVLQSRGSTAARYPSIVELTSRPEDRGTRDRLRYFPWLGYDSLGVLLSLVFDAALTASSPWGFTEWSKDQAPSVMIRV